jgi:hypothetical protein
VPTTLRGPVVCTANVRPLQVVQMPCDPIPPSQGVQMPCDQIPPSRLETLKGAQKRSKQKEGEAYLGIAGAAKCSAGASNTSRASGRQPSSAFLPRLFCEIVVLCHNAPKKACAERGATGKCGCNNSKCPSCSERKLLTRGRKPERQTQLGCLIAHRSQRH